MHRTNRGTVSTRAQVDLTGIVSRAGLQTMVLSLAVLYAVAAALDLVLPSDGRPAPARGSILMVAVLLLVGSANRRSRMTPRLRGHLAGLLCLLLTGLASGSVLSLGAPVHATVLAVAVVGSGALLPDRAWLATVCLVAGGAVVLAVGLDRVPPDQQEDTLLGVVIAVLVALALQRLMILTRGHVRRLTTELAEHARLDSLTGLLNRRGLTGDLEALPDLVPPGTQVGVVTIDVDGFKGVNDQLGHAAGDDVLTTIATRLRSLAAPTSLVCRSGGDEFLVVLVGGDEPEARRLAERVREQVRSGSGEPVWSVSVGAASGPLSGPATLSALLRSSDAGMYADKRRRRADDR